MGRPNILPKRYYFHSDDRMHGYAVRPNAPLTKSRIVSLLLWLDRICLNFLKQEISPVSLI